MKILIIIHIVLLFISCSIYKGEVNLSNNIVTPTTDNWESIPLREAQDSILDQEWWKAFEDKQLDSIMNVFLSNNYDLKLAASSLESAKALARINGANLLPDVATQVNNSKNEQNFSGSPFEEASTLFNPSGGSMYSETYGLSLTSRWEIDIWGKLYSERFSALKEYESSKNEHEYLRFSIIAQAVKIYFNLVEAKEQMVLSESSVSAFEDIFNIVEERYNQGVRSSLDYRLSLSNLLIARASLEQRRMILDGLARQMETLIGVYPSGKLDVSDNLSLLLPEIPRNLPSEIIEKRPDIRSAYNKIESSAGMLDYAKKMKFPSFNITGSTGSSSSDLKNLLNRDFSIWNLSSSLVLPIFQSGKIRANEKLSMTLLEQAELEYIYSILQAFSEIENKLAMNNLLGNQLTALYDAYIQSKEAYSLAKDRYDKGLTDLITVLDSQKRMFDTNGQMISIRKLLIENRIDLLICLGGGFNES